MYVWRVRYLGAVDAGLVVLPAPSLDTLQRQLRVRYVVHLQVCMYEYMYVCMHVRQCMCFMVAECTVGMYVLYLCVCMYCMYVGT